MIGWRVVIKATSPMTFSHHCMNRAACGGTNACQPQDVRVPRLGSNQWPLPNMKESPCTDYRRRETP